MSDYDNPPPCQFIGTSLSFCIQYLLKSDNVVPRFEDIALIICGTACENISQFEEMIERYAEIYWDQNPEKGKELAQQFWQSGKIYQPKLYGRSPVHVGRHNLWLPTNPEALEDLILGREAEEAMDKPTIPWEDVKKELELE